VESLTGRRGLVECKRWQEMRPVMIMIDPSGKRQIFEAWSEACRIAGDKCNLQLWSTSSVVDKLDRLAKEILN